MSDMKCPFCKEEIISDLCLMFNKKDKDYTNGRQIYKCIKCGLLGDSKLFQELAKYKKQVKKLRKQNRTLTESLDEYFNKWIDANIQAIKNKDQIRYLTEQEQARHQAIIDQIKGGK